MAKFYKGKSWQELIKKLEKMEPLSLVKIDPQAMQACKENNDAHIKKETEVPQPGGNLDQLKKILGSTKMPEAEEYTMVQWESAAYEIVLLNLISDYEKKNGYCAIIDPKTLRIGMSFKPHKKVENIYQIIYIKQISNQIA